VQKAEGEEETHENEIASPAFSSVPASEPSDLAMEGKRERREQSQ